MYSHLSADWPHAGMPSTPVTLRSQSIQLSLSSVSESTTRKLLVAVMTDFSISCYCSAGFTTIMITLQLWSRKSQQKINMLDITETSFCPSIRPTLVLCQQSQAITINRQACAKLMKHISITCCNFGYFIY